jgi:hypothetical protein
MVRIDLGRKEFFSSGLWTSLWLDHSQGVPWKKHNIIILDFGVLKDRKRGVRGKVGIA